MLSHKRSQEKGKQLNTLEVQKQLKSFEHHAAEGSQKKGSRQSQKKWSKNQEASKDNMRSVNQGLVAPAGCSGKKPGRKQDICSWRLKPVLRRKWGGERNQAQHHSPSSSGREKLHLGSEKTFYLDGLRFSRGTLWNKANYVNYPHSFSQCPLDPRIGALRVDIINTCIWNPSPQKKRTYLNRSIESGWQKTGVKPTVQASYQHILRQFTGKVRYNLPSFAVALGQEWPVGSPGH